MILKILGSVGRTKIQTECCASIFQGINFRVIAAPNQDLQRRVAEGKSRSDLYHRPKMVHLPVPPLRAREGDVLLLANAFLAMHGALYGKRQMFLTSEAQQALLDWHWSGNVRELRNMLEQIVLMAQHDAITPNELVLVPNLSGDDIAPLNAAPPRPDAEHPLNLESMERQYLITALGKAKWNVTRAAQMLGLSGDALRYRIEKFSITSGSRSTSCSFIKLSWSRQ